MVFTAEGLFEVAISTRTQSQLCTATSNLLVYFILPTHIYIYIYIYIFI